MRCWKDQLMKILMNSALNKLFKTQSSTDWMCRLVSLQRNSDESDLKLKLRQRDGAARTQRLFFFCQRRWKRNEGQKKRKREKTEREKGRGQSVKQPMTQVMKEWVHSAGWRWVRDGGHRHHHIFKSKNKTEELFLQLCRFSSGRRVSGLCRDPCWSPRAWRRWCRRNPPPPPRASGTSPRPTRCPHTGDRPGQTDKVKLTKCQKQPVSIDSSGRTRSRHQRVSRREDLLHLETYWIIYNR